MLEAVYVNPPSINAVGIGLIAVVVEWIRDGAVEGRIADFGVAAAMAGMDDACVVHV